MDKSSQDLVAAIESRYPIRNPLVRAALLAVDRGVFLAEHSAAGTVNLSSTSPYDDAAWPVKISADGQPLSSSTQPSLTAMMLDVLDLRPGDDVLEIGAATGFNAALLGNIVSASGRVVSIDIEEDVLATARRALRAAAGGDNVRLLNADASVGAPAYAPYDAIICTAAVTAIPSTWVRQLKDGGRMLLPLQLKGLTLMALLRKEVGSAMLGRLLFPCGFMPLRGPLYREEHQPILVPGLGALLRSVLSMPMPAMVRGQFRQGLRAGLWAALHHPKFRVLEEETPQQEPDFESGYAYGLYWNDHDFAVWQKDTLYATDAVRAADLLALIQDWEAGAMPDIGAWSLMLRYGESCDGDDVVGRRRSITVPCASDSLCLVFERRDLL